MQEGVGLEDVTLSSVSSLLLSCVLFLPDQVPL